MRKRRMMLALALAPAWGEMAAGAGGRAGWLWTGPIAGAGMAAAEPTEKQLADRMRRWILEKGREPTSQELAAKGDTFRKAWEAYKKGRTHTVREPTKRDVYLATKMRAWIRDKGRDPTEEELRKNAEMRRAHNAYRRVLAYRREQREQADSKRTQHLVQAAKREHQRAVDCLGHKRYALAIRLFNALLKNENAADLHDEIKEKLKEIDLAGQAELEQAAALVAAKKYHEALAAYKGVAETFKGVGAATEAQKARTALQKNSEVVRALRLRRAEVLLAQAYAAHGREQYLDALTLYEELATKYADLPQGRQASAKLAAMRADKAVMAKVEATRRQRDIRLLTAQADTFQLNGLIDKCIEKLRELMARYPDAPEAQTAKARIERLKGEP